MSISSISPYFCDIRTEISSSSINIILRLQTIQYIYYREYLHIIILHDGFYDIVPEISSSFLDYGKLTNNSASQNYFCLLKRIKVGNDNSIIFYILIFPYLKYFQSLQYFKYLYIFITSSFLLYSTKNKFIILRLESLLEKIVTKILVVYNGDMKLDNIVKEYNSRERASHNIHHFISHSYLEFLINNKFFKLN